MSGKFGKNYPALVQVRAGEDKERIFFFAAAGLAAFLFFTVIFVLNFKDQASAKEVVPAANTIAETAVGAVTLLSPESSIRAGTKLSDVRFKEIYWPRSQVPQGAVRDQAELREFYAAVEIPEGMPVQRSHLTKEALGISLPLTPGNRAVSIEVDATSGIEGFALPGTRVDVVLTAMDAGELSSKIITQNARVLSYGGDTTRQEQVMARNRASGSGREIKRTLTLDVSPQDALKIQTAKELGRLSLLMRSADDYKTSPVTELTKHDVSSNSNEVSKKKNCSLGRMRMEGKEYIIGCDGSYQQIDFQEP